MKKLKKLKKLKKKERLIIAEGTLRQFQREKKQLQRVIDDLTKKINKEKGVDKVKKSVLEKNKTAESKQELKKHIEKLIREKIDIYEKFKYFKFESDKYQELWKLVKEEIGLLKEENSELQLIIDTLGKKKTGDKNSETEDIKSYKLEINKLKEYSDTLKEQTELLKSELAEYKPYEDFIREIKSEKETYIEALKKVHYEALYRPSEDLWAETRESLFYQDNLINMLVKLP